MYAWNRQKSIKQEQREDLRICWPRRKNSDRSNAIDITKAWADQVCFKNYQTVPIVLTIYNTTEL